MPRLPRWIYVVLVLAGVGCGAGARGRPGPAATGVPVRFAASSGDSLRGVVYGRGDSGVAIIAHGGYSTLESWDRQATELAAAGLRVLVFQSRAAAEYAARGDAACMYDAVCQSDDVLDAVAHLRGSGVRTVHLMGGSMGAAAVAEAAIRVGPAAGRLVLLAPAEISAPERLGGRKLFVIARYDSSGAGPRLPALQAQYARVPQPKRLVLLEGRAHAQRLFLTNDGPALMRSIVGFFREP